jgi:transposase-like protein
MEQGGRVFARVVPDVKSGSILPHLRERIMPQSMIFSDESNRL